MSYYKIKNKYNKEELLYIVYNNRSLSNVVYNFLPELNINQQLLLQKLEKDIKISKFIFSNNKSMGLEINELDLTQLDNKVTLEDIKKRTNIILDSIGKFTDDEYNFLLNKGFNDNLIRKYKLGSISNIKNQEDLDILGISTHPIMSKMFDGGTIGGGIIIPLFNKDEELINCSFRKISDYNKLKYTHTCPDVFVWGVDDIEKGDIVWLVEGIFDKYALQEKLPEGSKVISTSSATISSVQYYKIISKRPSKINFICDNDSVGFRTGAILQKVFRINKIDCSTFYFDESKDAAEHLLVNNGDIFDLIKINITKELINEKLDDYEDRIPLNFFDYLKNRKF